MKVTFIVGLPGSGKTYAGRKIAGDGLFLDDLSLLHQADAMDELASALRTGPVVVADCYLCLFINRLCAQEKVQDIAKANGQDLTIEWIYFENDPEACRRNVRRRKHGGDKREVEGMIKLLSGHYLVPEGVKTIPVWEPHDVGHHSGNPSKWKRVCDLTG